MRKTSFSNVVYSDLDKHDAIDIDNAQAHGLTIPKKFTAKFSCHNPLFAIFLQTFAESH